MEEETEKKGQRRIAETNRLVASYMVEESLPISTVESPSFQKHTVLSEIQVPGGQPPSDRKTFASFLDQPYAAM